MYSDVIMQTTLSFVGLTSLVIHFSTVKNYSGLWALYKIPKILPQLLNAHTDRAWIRKRSAKCGENTSIINRPGWLASQREVYVNRFDNSVRQNVTQLLTIANGAPLRNQWTWLTDRKYDVILYQLLANTISGNIWKKQTFSNTMKKKINFFCIIYTFYFYWRLVSRTIEIFACLTLKRKYYKQIKMFT